MLIVSDVVTELGRNSPRRNVRVHAFFLMALLFIIGMLVFVLKQSATAPNLDSNYITATLAGRDFRLETVDTPETKNHGLSGRTALPKDYGMLFVFTEPDQACFWMKDMQFNLDILWFDADRKLIYQQQNIAPSTYPQSFCPPMPASYVVEINPGIVQLEAGDQLKL